MKTWIKVIHTAKTRLGLSDEDYRAVLLAGGVSSSKDIHTKEQFDAVMVGFREFGFVFDPRASMNRAGNRTTVPGTDSNMISQRQEYYIRGLQKLAMREKSEHALRTLVRRIGGADDIRFLTRPKASAVIHALRDICLRAGINPDSKDPQCSSE